MVLIYTGGKNMKTKFLLYWLFHFSAQPLLRKEICGLICPTATP